MRTSEQINELAKALAAAQIQMPKAEKESNNPAFRSKYASLSSLMEAAFPALNNNGLTVTQLVGQRESGELCLTTILMHTSGQFIETTVNVPYDPVKNVMHAIGSALTYMRRYSFAAIVGVMLDEDDDGNAAGTPKKETQPQPQPQPQKTIMPLSNQQVATIAEFEKRLGKDRYTAFICELCNHYQKNSIYHIPSEAYGKILNSLEQKVKLEGIDEAPF